MPSTLSLIAKLQRDFPDIRFADGDVFRWSPSERTVYSPDTSDTASLLHEVSHAILGHEDYENDIDLIKMERDAWERAAGLAGQYSVTIDDDAIQDALDTYRDWLHARSTCPACQATGIQTARRSYMCLACRGEWHVNEARSCALRRYRLSDP